MIAKRGPISTGKTFLTRPEGTELSVLVEDFDERITVISSVC